MTRMSRWTRLYFALGAIVASLVALAPRPAHADGAPLPPYGHEADIEMPGQKAIIVYDAEAAREDLILSVKLLGGPEAAWVVPVPSLPEVSASSAEWFSQLSDLTKPEIITEVEIIHEPGALEAVPVEDAPEGVELLSRERVGVYDVSILSADEPGALLEWLNEHGYVFPERGEPILGSYVEEGGWYFMAARVLPGETANLEGDVQPLRLSFDTEQPVYPMRLTALVDDYMDVLIYVLADHRMEIEGVGLETEFAGELTLEPVASEEGDLVDLLTGRPYYVTKLRSWYFDAREIADDLYLQRAPSDDPYRKVIYHTVYEYRSEDESPDSCCPGCCSGLAPLGLVVGLGLVGRYRSRHGICSD